MTWHESIKALIAIGVALGLVWAVAANQPADHAQADRVQHVDRDYNYERQ